MSRFAGLWLACCLAALAQTTPSASSDSPAAAGAKIFRHHCESCHGKGGHAGHAPDLAESAITSGDRDAELFQTISNGVPGTEMQPYLERLGADDIRRVMAYLHSATRPASPVKGDPAQGQALFWGKGGCGACHAIGNRGNRVGPDLSRVGRRRSSDYLRESLVDPSAYIVNGYSGVTVVTRDGKTIRGIEISLDDFSVVMQDFSGKVYSFERSGVRSVTSDTASLMPAYGGVFSPAELDNIVAYLTTLGKPAVRP